MRSAVFFGLMFTALQRLVSLLVSEYVAGYLDVDEATGMMNLFTDVIYKMNTYIMLFNNFW